MRRCPESRFARFRTAGSALTTLLGFAALLYGLFGPDLATEGILVYMGLGALLIFIGVAMLSVRLIRPLVWALGWPATRIGGAAGFLARDNAKRNPQRTASTAAALMIGLALVTLVAVLAAGITTSFRGAVTKIWKNADYAITAQNNFTPIPPAAAEAAAKSPIVEAVGNVRTGDAGAFGKAFFATAVNPPAATMFTLDWVQGSDQTMATLGANGAFTDKNYAKTHHLQIGSPIKLTFANGQQKTFTIKGIFDPPPGGSPFGKVTISQATWDAYNESPRNLYAFVRVRGGETPANQKRLEKILAPYPERQGRDAAEVRRQPDQRAQLDPQHPLRAARTLRDRQRVRDREHARAHGVRAHARDRDAARDRHDTPPGAADDPARERDHRADRRRPRDRARNRARRTARRARRLHPVLAAARLADHLRGDDDVVGILAAIFPARRAARLNVLEALQYE